nr:PilW family protein [Luteimonas terricola]
MIALLLGLVVVAAASGLFLTNKRVYASTETINRIQENSRVSFEIMSRDIREAAAKPCGNSSTTVNLLQSRDSAWWEQFGEGLRGYDGNQVSPGTVIGTGVAQRVAGTDAIDLHLVNDGDYAVVKHDTPSATLDLNNRNGLVEGDIVMVCNTEYSLIFQITGFNGTGLLHTGAGSITPGNCGSEFQFEDPDLSKCSGASAPNGYCVMGATSAQCVKSSEDPAALARIQTSRWYIGNNARGGRSLYRAQLVNRTATLTPNIVDAVEIAEGIGAMQLQYRSNGSTVWRDATAVADWTIVNAVRVNFTAEGTEGALSGGYLDGTDGDVLNRSVSHVVAIRNREGVL